MNRRRPQNAAVPLHLLKLSLGFAFLQLLGGEAAVVLEGNAYHGLLVAINPAIPEDQKIIASIKEMITEASFYLFNATQRRVYLGNISILIPSTWKAYAYAKPKQDLYTKADVIVAPPYWKHGNDPYTLQYGGCGEKGKYIHFTPDFLINDDLIGIYGSRGRLFVHEWAHLQWGVFDEYDSEKPFYISGQNQVKVTRCSSDLTGIYVCEKQSCTQGNCVIDQVTGLLKEGCTFIHDKDQNASSSIMYMQSLSSVFRFCDASNHNIDAPNLQNRMCSYKSTWDVIMDSDDFKSNLPLASYSSPMPPTFSLLQATDRVICLVLDVSSSMNENNRLHRMRQAAEVYLLQIVEQNSYVGIVTFNNSGEVKSPIRQIINDDVRKQLASNLPVASFGERTSLCAGLQLGLEEIKKHNGDASSSEIILLTSRDDSTFSKCFSDVINSGSIIHTIALGPFASTELEKLGRMTGGLSFFATDRPDSNSLMDVFTAIAAGHGDVSDQPVQMESAAERVKAYSQINRTTTIDCTVGRNTFFVATWQINKPTITLRDPRGKSYTTEDFDVDPILHIARLQIPGIAWVGDWTYTLTNTHVLPDVFTMTTTSRVVKSDVSAISVRVHTNKDTNSYPSPMIVYAQVNQGFSPILGANVTAIIEPENGDPIILDLFDNGAGADVFKNDGVYSKYLFSFTRNGRYSLKVHVQRDNKTIGPYLTILWSNAMYIPGYLENGTIQMNAPRPLMKSEDTQIRSGGFRRITSGGSFSVSAVPTGPYTDVFPPCKITDLDARIEGDKVVLTWTAPGDDFDQGQAVGYEIRASGSPLELRDNFENAASMNISRLTPQEAGYKETFMFKPEAFATANITLIYMAIRTVDKAFLYSDISNIAQAVAFLPQKDILIAHGKNNALTIVLTTCGILVAALCLIITATVWNLKKKKNMAFEEAVL
ncbi:calcium-activated chloride channel regulator 2-like [Hemicordylus capensis]|uniref:calcium-activated chloride channel regulator 2-like n=1 Tax=Hemicordylus capensis TaxID=884348 RepID=UPI002304BFB8|nr:calcium-activated chloride channel regulator 2-like [Hemicordylus capensis]